jgi:hypothetical protein
MPLDIQNFHDLVTMRNLLPLEDGEFEATEKISVGEPWIDHYKGEPAGHIFFGHDARRGLQESPHATGLDTGCAYGEKESLCPFALYCCSYLT